MIHFMCNFHQKFKLLTSNYKINHHGKNEIRHDHLKFIPVKEISFTVKTKQSRPKQIICFKNKSLLRAKTKVVVSSVWSKAIQVHGASQHNMSTMLIFEFPFASLLLFFMREQVSDKPVRTPCVVLPITSHDSLRVRILI